MKKKLLLSGVLVSIALMAIGCGSEPAPKEEADFRCKQGTELAPEWTCVPILEGGIVAVGTAQSNAGGDVGFQMEEAMANGRTALARRIATKVQTLMKNWKRATGQGVDQTFEKNVETVSKQSANQTLNGSKMLKRWVSKDGTMYVLVGMTDNAPIFEATKNAAKTSFKNDQALWQQFQSKKAMDEMDAEFAKE